MPCICQACLSGGALPSRSRPARRLEMRVFELAGMSYLVLLIWPHHDTYGENCPGLAGKLVVILQ